MALNLMIPHSQLLLLSLLLVFHSSFIPTCHSQSSSPQNIETFYPNEAPTPEPQPMSPEQLAPAPPAAVSKSSSSNSKIAKAVAATAATTLVVSGLIFFLVYRCLRARRREEVVVPQNQINGFERIEGNFRGLIVDENGLDVVYWRKLQGRNSKRDFQKEVFRSAKIEEHQEEEENEDERKKSESVQEFPLLRGKSSTSHLNIVPEDDESKRITTRTSLPASTIPKRTSSAPPTSLPPPQPIQARKSSPPWPPSLKSSSKPPSTSRETPATNGKPGNSSGEDMSASGNGQVKLKPLDWDRVNSNAHRSMVRDRADGVSVRVDQDLMEALFGYVAINRRSPKGKSDSVNQSRETSPPG